jgi:hypothetical protein
MFSNRALIAVAATAAAAAAIAFVFSRTGQPAIAPGTEVLGVDADTLRSLTFRTGAMTLTARHNASRGAFEIEVTFSDRRPAQHCNASRDLAGVLPGLARIAARRQLTPQQVSAEFPVQVGTLTFEDQIASEPIGSYVVRATQDRSKVAMVFSGTAVETTTPSTAFTRLAQGCAALAAK